MIPHLSLWKEPSERGVILRLFTCLQAAVLIRCLMNLLARLRYKYLECLSLMLLLAMELECS